jgi:carboxyl-terminal processing protease
MLLHPTEVAMLARPHLPRFPGRSSWRMCALLALVCATSVHAQSRAMPDSVRSYVAMAFTTFREQSVHRATVNWDSVEAGVFERTRSAQTPAETWGVLSAAFRAIDRHSFLMPPASAMQGMSAMAAPRPSGASAPLGQLLPGQVGLIAVPPHSGWNRPTYVDSLHAQLRALDGLGVCGWVVDLRQNTGGNMWPMLAGIGPLLAADVVGSTTTTPSGEGWHYRDGRAWAGGPTLPAEPMGYGTSVGDPPLRSATAPVALVLGRRTQSSGEMTAIAFLGRPNVRSFGDSTGGYASVNSSIPLRDGAQLIVTSAYPRDRLGRTYALTLGPDELVASADPVAGDRPVQAAADWVRQHPSCRARP